MSELVLSQPKGTYKFTIYSYEIDSKTKILVVFHDSLPFIFGKAQLMDSTKGHEECNAVADSIPILENSETIYENFINSLPDSDSNKARYQKSFAADLKKEFFLLKVDTSLIHISKEYIIRAFDKNNDKNLLISNDIKGIRLKTSSFIEIYSFYVSIIENKDQEYVEKTEKRTFSSICSEVCIYVIIGVVVKLAFYFIFKDYN